MLIEFRNHERGAISRVPMIDIVFDNGTTVEAELKGIYGRPTELFLDRVRAELGGILSGRVTPEAVPVESDEPTE